MKQKQDHNITLTGNQPQAHSIRQINENIQLIASETTWIEELAIEQLQKTAQLTGMEKVAGMPDLHPGRGYPVGAAFFSVNKIYPALVGNDIGCGMSLWQTTLKISKLNLDKLAKKFNTIDLSFNETWQELITERKAQKNIDNTDFDLALGTIGGGNHFAEFQAIDEIYLPDEFEKLELDKHCLQLLVHSGSRGFGQSILMDHLSKFNHHGLNTQVDDLSDYLQKHNEALRWAELNRELIALKFLKASRSKGHCVLDVNHNLVTPKSIAGMQGWLHRKGATPSDQGFVVIPGSRGDYSYLVKPINLESKESEMSLLSLAHGAGRKWKRGACQARLSHKYSREDLYRTALGSRVICGNKELLYDEAPQAYKNCKSVIDAMFNANLIEVVARLKPVLTFKTNGG